MSNVHVSTHPLVRHRLAILRDKNTPSPVFRTMVCELARLLFWEAAADMRLTSTVVASPLADCASHKLAERVGLVPILRAGLGMVDPILEWVPDAQVWHLGLYRDHRTMRPITYYNKLAGEATLDVCYLLDPMLATGGSAVAAITVLKEWGIKRLKFIGLIAAPEGVHALHAAHPDVPLHLAAVDSHLNENAYIVPGLGDAGDRQFGTHME